MTSRFPSAASDPTPGPVASAAHDIQLLPGMGTMLTRFFADVAEARERVEVECFIVNDGALGLLLAQALAKAVARGVRVRLLYDPVGSNETDSTYFDELRASGVEVRAYRGLLDAAAGKGSLVACDHGRVMVIDDRAAYTGGAAWGDQWLPKEMGGGGWHDVCTRTSGPVVADFAALFEERWREADGSQAPTSFDTHDRYPDVRLVGDEAGGNADILAEHIRRIDAARTRVWIANAYFYPTADLLGALTRAAARGVDVSVIVPGVSDLALLERAARSAYGAWIEAGFAIWEYQPVVKHCKYALVDDDWATVGTFNMNATSPLLVNEVNLMVSERAFVAQVGEQFVRDRARSKRVDAARIAKIGVGTRLLDSAAALVLDLTDAIR
jgi:cardiolipin synthase